MPIKSLKRNLSETLSLNIRVYRGIRRALWSSSGGLQLCKARFTGFSRYFLPKLPLTWKILSAVRDHGAFLKISGLKAGHIGYIFDTVRFTILDSYVQRKPLPLLFSELLFLIFVGRDGLILFEEIKVVQRALVGSNGWRQGIAVANVIITIQIFTSLARAWVKTRLWRIQRLDWQLQSPLILHRTTSLLRQLLQLQLDWRLRYCSMIFNRNLFLLFRLLLTCNWELQGCSRVLCAQISLIVFLLWLGSGLFLLLRELLDWRQSLWR